MDRLGWSTPVSSRAYVSFNEEGELISDPTIGTPYETENNKLLLYPSDPAPANFGIGLPWHSMLNFYNYELGHQQIGSHLFFKYTHSWLRIFPELHNDFWWKLDGDETYWENNPTYAGDGVKLERVKIYRHRKSPLVLGSVKKYSIGVGNSEAVSIASVTQNGAVLSNVQFAYSSTIDPYYVDKYVCDFPSMDPDCWQIVQNRWMGTLLLSKIVNLPNGEDLNSHFEFIAPVETAHPTNSFEYVAMTTLGEVSASTALLHSGEYFHGNALKNVTNNYVIKGHLSPLGKLTKIHYKKFAETFDQHNKNHSYLEQIHTENTYWRSRWAQNGDFLSVGGNVSSRNTVFKITAVVDKVFITEQKINGEELQYKYSFTGLSKNWYSEGGSRPHYNLNEEYQSKRTASGFQHSKMIGPLKRDASGNQLFPSTELEHHLGMLNGKIKSVTSFDEAGNLTSEVKNAYSVKLAFEPGMVRMANNRYNDYYEYSDLDKIPPFTAGGTALDFEEYVTGNYNKYPCKFLKSMPRIGAQRLYGPFTPSTPDDKGYGNSETYLQLNNIYSEASFFTPLVSSSTTNYFECDQENGIQEVTSYTYFDAEYDGSFEANKYAVISDDIGYDGRLINEPSFLLASKTTINSAALTNLKEEYFYYWDLKNSNRYTDALYGRVSFGHDFLTSVAEIFPIRDLLYQVRTTYGDGTQHSVYYEYGNLPIEHDGYVEYSIDPVLSCPDDDGNGIAGPTGGNQDDGNETCDSFGDPDCYNLPAGCFWQKTGQIPTGFCRTTPREVVCPCSAVADFVNRGEIELESGDVVVLDNYQGGGLTSNFKNASFLDGNGSVKSEDSGVQNVPNKVRNFALSRQFAQVENLNNRVATQVTFQTDGSITFENPESVVKTYQVFSVSRFGRPVEIQNIRGLKTRFEYSPQGVLNYKECVDNQYVREATAIFSIAAGLPHTITIGEGTDHPLISTYSYNDDRTVHSIENPNDILLEYEYDNFLRLKATRRMGVVLSENTYSNYPHPDDWYRNPEEFSLISTQNKVTTTAFLGNGGQNTVAVYVDPLGRKSGNENIYEGGQGASGAFYTNAVGYDIYGRTVASRPFGADGVFLDRPDDSGNINQLYKPAPRSEIKFVAREGLSLESGPKKTFSTCLVSIADLQEQIIKAGNDEGLNHLPRLSQLIKSETTDEDGKRYLSYTDINGLVIASISTDEDDCYAATVNKYDGKGNLVASVNPKEQITAYSYNYLSLPYQINSPDAGNTKVAYDIESNVISTINGEGKQTSFFFDAFGRQIEQTDGLSPEAFLNEGLPWLGLKEESGLYQVPFPGGTNKKTEKLWQYNDYEVMQGGTNALPDGFSSQNALGRLAATFSFEDGGELILGTVFSYNESGFVNREKTAFTPEDIEEIKYEINYGDHLLNGTPSTVSVDVNMDGPDFIHHFSFDGLGRVTKVALDVPSLEIEAQDVVEYVYDPSNTQIGEVKYLKGSDVLMSISNAYDIANRLTGTSSPLYAEDIVYDSGGEGYFNGNIFSTKSTYQIEDYVPTSTMMQAPSIYTYTYDGLNRLKEAKLNVDRKIFNGFDKLRGDATQFGTVAYSYDKTGNLTNILRGEFDPNEQQLGQVTAAMNFPEENNQLQSATFSGLGFAEPKTFEYGHNGVGYLSYDGKRDKSLSYTRGTYPLSAGNDEFAYDVNDARIHKKGDKNEFYLRNSAGQSLAIIDLNELEATWYAFGANRFAEIKTKVGDCGLVKCRPETPKGGSVDASFYTAQVNSNIGNTEVSQLNYPLTLFRVQLPDDTDFHLLAGELNGLDGRFNILQQIVIYSVDDLLVAKRISTEEEVDITFEEFLSERQVNPHDYLLNGFHICQSECPDEIFTCSQETQDEQFGAIVALKNAPPSVANNESFILLRLRSCNGSELYAYQEDLPQIPGGMSILQRINIDRNNYEPIAYEINGDDGLISTVANIHNYVYRSWNPWILDGYEACVSKAVCTDEVPDCGTEGMPDFTDLQDAMNTSLSLAAYTSYPVKVQRIRFCDGTDVYLLPSETESIHSGNYSILQEVRYNTSSERIDVFYDNNEVDHLTYTGFLSLRTRENILRLADYPDCDSTVCSEQDCSEITTTQQEAFLDSLYQLGSSRLIGVTYPLTLELINLCDGNDAWLLSDEAVLIPGIGRTGLLTEISSAETIFAVSTIDGSFHNVNLADFFNRSENEHFVSVNGALGCADRQLANCQSNTGDVGCSHAQEAGQRIALRNLPHFYNSCNNRPSQLHLVELCSGDLYYLTLDEISSLPGRVSIHQTIELPTNPRLYRIQVGGTILNETQDFIYCHRFDDLDFIYEGECTLDETTETVTCNSTLTTSNLRLEAESNNFHVDLVRDIKVVQSCSNGSEHMTNTTLTETFSLYNFYADTFPIVSPSTHFVSVDFLRLREVISGEYLEINFEAQALRTDYPGIDEYLNGHTTADAAGSAPYSLDMLLSASYVLPPSMNFDGPEPWPRRYTQVYEDLINLIINFAMISHSGLTLSEINRRIFFDFTFLHDGQSPTHYRYELYSGLMHQPSKTGYVIEPCAGNLVINNSINGKDLLLSPPPVLSAIWGEKSTVRCNQFFKSEDIIGGPKQIASKDNCIDDSQLNGCSGYLYGNYSSRDFVCYPGNPPGIPYTVYPTVSPYNSYDLTEIVDLDLKFDNPIQRACESTITERTVNCESNSRPTICLDGNCDYDPCHPATFFTSCTPAEESARDDQLAVLAQVFSQASHADVIYPINVYAIAFCGGEMRYLLANEMEYLSISYRIQRTLSIDEPEQRIRIDNSGEIIHGTLADFLHQRKSSPPLIFTLAPVYDNPAPGLDPVTGDPIDGALPEVSSPVTYYLYDHLGNTRVTFRADAPDLIAIDYAADYYPYGKVLREYRPCGPNRYLSTYHERDAETGYDNRGARLYDSEIGRFLGVDPLASKFPGHSPYNYVLGNPISLVDPDGRMATGAGGDPPQIGILGIFRELGHNLAVAAYNSYQRIQENTGMKLFREGNSRARVNYNADGTIPVGNSIAIQNEPSKGLLGETLDAAIDIANVATLGEFAMVRGGIAAPVLAARVPASGLARIIPTEPLAQGNAVNEILKRMDAGDLHVFAEPIHTVKIDGEVFMLDGHNRLEAAKRGGYDLDITELSADDASKMYPDKVEQIKNGEFD